MWSLLLTAFLAFYATSEASNMNMGSLRTDLNLEPVQRLNVIAFLHTVYGTQQARIRVSCYGVPFSDQDIVAEFRKGKYIERTNVNSVPSCQGLKNDVDNCVPLTSHPAKLAKLRSYEAEYLDHVGADPDTNYNYVRTRKINRRLREFEDEVTLVDEVNVLWERVGVAMRVFIVMDACNGSLLHISNRLAFNSKQTTDSLRRHRRSVYDDLDSCNACPVGKGGNPVLGEQFFGPDDICLGVSTNGDQCTMSRNGTIVHDGRVQEMQCTDSPVVSFTCNDGPEDSINGGYSPSLDAFYATDVIGSVVKHWYYYAIGNRGIPPVCSHFGTDVINSLWTGRAILLGDGSAGVAYPFTSLHAVCHEYAHYLTQTMSDLLLVEQAGGLNDAVADSFAKVCEAYTNGGQVTDWRLGPGLVNGWDAIRYFDDPPRDGFSIDNATLFQPGLNSHYSCGVFNKFFYCLVQVKGIPIRQAFGLYLHANMIYWNSDVDFEEAAVDVLHSAHDSGINTDSVQSCFESVALLTDSGYGLDEVEWVMCPNELTSMSVYASQTRNPYFRLCACQSTCVRVTARGATILFSTGSAYSAAIGGGLDVAEYCGSLSDDDVYVRIVGASRAVKGIDVEVQF